MLFTDNLKDLSFKGFIERDWHIIFKRLGIYKECKNNEISYFQYLKSLLRIFCVAFYGKDEPLQIKKYGDKKVLLFQSYYSRQGTVKQFENVSKLSEGTSIRVIEEKEKLRFRDGLKYLMFYFPSWLNSLSSLQLTYFEKITILTNLFHLHLLDKKFDAINLTSYSLLVTYYDSLVYDSFVTNKLKRLGLKTATLEHGQFTAWRENVVENSGIELRCFNSDYLLCWNNFTVEEALKEGISRDKLVIVGILGNVGQNIVDCQKPCNRVFGVVIGHPMFDEENKKLVTAANILSERIGYKFCLKLHPLVNENYFKDLVNDKCTGIVPRETSMSEYASLVEFSLCGSSSVFVELVFREHETIRYSCKDIKDKFRDIDIDKQFSKPEDVLEAYNSNACSNSDLFDFLCTIKNVDHEYSRFFESFE